MQVSEPLVGKVRSRLYETDFCAWVAEQGQLLRDGCWEQVDLENVIEEIEALGRQQRQELRNWLAVLLGHLLKWEFQSGWRSRSWRSTIRIQRREILVLIRESPSLRPYLEEALELAYANGRDLALAETSLAEEVFPVVCPYGWDLVMDEGFFPGVEEE